MIALPEREFIKLRTINNVIRISITPITNVEVVLMPVIPVAPLIITLPSASKFKAALLLRLKCNPFESTPR